MILLTVVVIIASTVVALVSLAIQYWYVTLPAIALIIIYKKRDKIFPKRKEKYNSLYWDENLKSYSWHSRWNRKTSWDNYAYEQNERKRIPHRKKKIAAKEKNRDERIPLEEKAQKRKRKNSKTDYETIKEKKKPKNKRPKKYWFERTFKTLGRKFKQSDTYDISDCLELLNLDRDCSEKQIKERYRELALRYHPDRAKNQDSEKFKAINNAYEMLLDNLEVV